jgi:branched-chain amino acid transport system substrate-binding protein
MIRLYLNQIGGKAGNYNLTLKTYNDSTAAKGAWDEAACAKNAADHVANADEVAVMGTFNSGCAKIEVPVLNQDNTGPMLMVSHANTNPGLTKAWDEGEPDRYYPSGSRNYARVLPTDDLQGDAAATFAADDLKVKKCFVLNDTSVYGAGVAKAFVTSAESQGIEIVGDEPWKPTGGYTTIFKAAKTAGADCVYLGGVYGNNGGQLIKDKVAILGKNSGVKLLAPDGFTGYDEMLALPQADGMYLTYSGLADSELTADGGTGQKLLDAYKSKYGSPPVGGYTLYGVAAIQVILAAIAKSDGTRKGVTDAVFGGSGITVPASESALGKEFSIDPSTGDISAKDLTVELVKGGRETLFKSLSLA